MPITEDRGYLRAVLDALPSPVFVVDRDMRIHDTNRAGSQFLGQSAEMLLRRLCGEVLHCINGRDCKDHCGTTTFCADCVVRQTVTQAGTAKPSSRQTAHMCLQKGDRLSDVWLLVTATPLAFGGDDLLLLVLEDATELAELQQLVPMCSHCRRVRDDVEYWQDVEHYLYKHTALRFTHGICPDCLRTYYPDVFASENTGPAADAT